MNRDLWIFLIAPRGKQGFQARQGTHVGTSSAVQFVSSGTISVNGYIYTEIAFYRHDFPSELIGEGCAIRMKFNRERRFALHQEPKEDQKIGIQRGLTPPVKCKLRIFCDLRGFK